MTEELSKFFLISFIFLSYSTVFSKVLDILGQILQKQFLFYSAHDVVYATMKVNFNGGSWRFDKPST